MEKKPDQTTPGIARAEYIEVEPLTAPARKNLEKIDLREIKGK